MRSGFSLGASAEKLRSLSNSTHEQEMFLLIVIKWVCVFFSDSTRKIRMNGKIMVKSEIWKIRK